MNKTVEKIIRAIDVGYGQTKYVHSISGNKPLIKYFPSIVRKLNINEEDRLFDHSITTTQVEIKGQKYEVGPGATDPLHNTAIHSEDFSKSIEYKALFLGALYFMKPVNKIDVLVLGLPVQFLTSKKAELKKRFQGKHILPDGREVFIERIEVIAQPIGGYLKWKENKSSSILQAYSNILIIDPGFYTFDYVVINNGSPCPVNRGSFPAGMSILLQFLADQISKKFSIEYTNLRRIEDGIISGNFYMYGKQVDLKPLLKPFQKETVHITQKIVSKLGDGGDIDAIVLIGGAAGMFSSAIRTLFPKHALLTQSDYICANAYGFWLYGRDLVAAEKHGQR